MNLAIRGRDFDVGGPAITPGLVLNDFLPSLVHCWVRHPRHARPKINGNG